MDFAASIHALASALLAAATPEMTRDCAEIIQAGDTKGSAQLRRTFGVGRFTHAQLRHEESRDINHQIGL